VRGIPQWGWHVDAMFVRINGKFHYLRRAADHEGEVLEAYVSQKRDRKAALLIKRSSTLLLATRKFL